MLQCLILPRRLSVGNLFVYVGVGAGDGAIEKLFAWLCVHWCVQACFRRNPT